MRPHHAARAVLYAGEQLQALVRAAAGAGTGSAAAANDTGGAADLVAVHRAALQLAQRCSAMALGQQSLEPQAHGMQQGVLEMVAVRDLLQVGTGYGWTTQSMLALRMRFRLGQATRRSLASS